MKHIRPHIPSSLFHLTSSFFLLTSSFFLLFAPGCRREDVREMTVVMPKVAEKDKAAVEGALSKYGGIDKGSYKWDFAAKTLTLRYDSMQVAQANIRYAIAEKGVEVSFPSNTTGRAGH